MDARAELKKLKKLLDEYDAAYYQEDAPKVDDATYDALKAKAERLEKALGGNLFGFESKVGAAAAEGFKKVVHKIPMLSEEKLHTMEDLRAFVERIARDTAPAPLEIMAEPKIDGLSFSAVFKGGKLVQASTRGDGNVGEDITENIKAVRGFPSEIPYARGIEMRGEVYMAKADFLALNEAQAKAGEKTFANPRNAAAGSLRQLDAGITKARRLSYIVYAWGEAEGELEWKTQAGFYDFATRMGFSVHPDFAVCRSPDEMARYYERLAETRAQMPFDIDGAMYKVNDIALQKRLGYIARAPRWSVAHKFPPEQAISKIDGIALQVGRTGVVTPVAVLSPVNVGGVLVSRATLHNADYIASKDIRVGDFASIVRRGDVIPRVENILKDHRDGSQKPYVFPSVCPVCGAELARRPGEVALRCTNKNCDGKKLEHIKYFISRDAFDVDGIGEKQIELFYSRGWVRTPEEIWTRLYEHRAEILALEGYGEKSVANIFASIERARDVALDKLIYALGINGVGGATATLLAEHFASIDALRTANADDLNALFGVGEVMANDIRGYFTDGENARFLDVLLPELHVKNPEKRELDAAHPLYKKTMVFTGTLGRFSREQAEKIARGFGALTTSSVSRKTDFVVAGENAGTKLERALKLGVRVLGEDEFIKITNT